MDPQLLMALLQASGSMMSAAAPSTNPASGNFGHALGQGLMGGVKGYALGDEQRRSQEYMQLMKMAMERKAAEEKADKNSLAAAMAYAAMPGGVAGMQRQAPRAARNYLLDPLADWY